MDTSRAVFRRVEPSGERWRTVRSHLPNESLGHVAGNNLVVDVGSHRGTDMSRVTGSRADFPAPWGARTVETGLVASSRQSWMPRSARGNATSPVDCAISQAKKLIFGETDMTQLRTMTIATLGFAMMAVPPMVFADGGDTIENRRYSRERSLGVPLRMRGRPGTNRCRERPWQVRSRHRGQCLRSRDPGIPNGWCPRVL